MQQLRLAPLRYVWRPAARQVDLDALHGELLGVVDQTMQPTKASLWLRPLIQRLPRTGT